MSPILRSVAIPYVPKQVEPGAAVAAIAALADAVMNIRPDEPQPKPPAKPVGSVTRWRGLLEHRYVAGECLGCQTQFAIDVRLPLPTLCPDCGTRY